MTGPLHLAQAVLEGVALAMADGHAALMTAGATIDRVSLTGGGARSALWARLVAAAIGQPLHVANDQRSGPALGAARLARAALGGPLMTQIESHGTVVSVDARLTEQLARKRSLFHGHAGSAAS